MDDTINIIGKAMLAKRHPCPKCGVRGGTACKDEGRQYVPLADTHQERIDFLTVVSQKVVDGAGR